MEIYQKAFDIIERYFGTEEEDKDVSEPSPAEKIFGPNPVSSLQIAPAADSNQFTFGSGGESQQTQQPGFNF